MLRNNSGKNKFKLKLTSLFRKSEQGIIFGVDNPDALMPRRNVMTWSEDAALSPSTVSAGATVTANQALDFDGLLTLDRIDFGTGDYRYKGVTNPPGGVAGTWTYSADVYSPSKATIVIRVANNANGTDSFFRSVTLTTGVTRVSVSGTLTGISGATVIDVGFDNRSGSGGDGIVGFIYAGRQQLERGSVATSYQKVTDWYTEYMGGEPVVRRNLLLWTENTSNAAWLATDTTPTDASVVSLTGAPLTLCSEGSAGAASLRQIVSGINAGTAVTRSLIVKRGNTDFVRLIIGDATGGTNGVRWWFNTATGLFDPTPSLFGTTPPTSVSADVEVLGSGEFRLTLKATIQHVTGSVGLYSMTSSADGATARVNGGTYYIGAQQLELGSNRTAYQPVTDWTTEVAADEARRLAIRSRITLFQDVNGTQPVTAIEQQVGLRLDSSSRVSRLGPNLVVNPTFDTDTSGWTSFGGATLAVVSGQLQVTADATGTSQGARQTLTNLKVGTSYLVLGVSSLTSGTGTAKTSLQGKTEQPGLANFTFAASATSHILDLYINAPSAAAVGTFDNVSVREVIAEALPTGRGPEIWNDASVNLRGNATRVSPGVYRIYTPDGTLSDVYMNTAPLIVGEYYEALVTIDSVTTAGVGTFGVGATPAVVFPLTVGPKRCIFKATQTVDADIKRQGASPQDFQVSNVSFRWLPGYHATQATQASKPKFSARVNRFVKSQEMSAAVSGIGGGTAATPWEYGAGISAPVSGVLAPDGSTTGSTATATSTVHALRQTVAASAGESVKILWHAKDATFTPKYCVYNVTGVADIIAPTAYPAGTSVANGWTRYEVTVTVPVGCTSIAFYPLRDSNATGSIALWGADLRTADDAARLIPVYQRVNSATDYDTVGFPPYLLYDGVDDGMATGNIDFSSTDKMTVMASITKLTDAGAGVILETGGNTDTDAGTFALLTSGVGAGAGPADRKNYSLRVKGDSSGAAYCLEAHSYTAPNTSVVTMTADIAQALGSELQARVNGANPAATYQNTNAAGAGNFTSRVLNIGRRAGGTLFANFRDYGFAIIGRALAATEIRQVERELARAAKVAI